MHKSSDLLDVILDVILGVLSRAAGLACAGLVAAASAAAQPAAVSGAVPRSVAGVVSGAVPGDSGFVYARDYPFIDYQGVPSHNEIASLQQRLASGQVSLEAHGARGYLDALLAALSIDPASQCLVFSKTSLQVDLISSATPRAIYFNDDTYVAWVPGSHMLEIATMDSQLGAVFYTLPQPPQPDRVGEPRFQHETSRCLTCHDTFSMGGGGVPSFLFLSAYSRAHNQILTQGVAQTTTDATPLDERWGGWYVSGQLGVKQLGNLMPGASGTLAASAAQPLALAQLSGLFDTQPYLTATSDVVALLILEHEVYVHDMIIRASFKSRMLMEAQQRGAGASGLSWEQLTPVTQQRMTSLLEPLVRALLFSGAAPLTASAQGDAAFQRSFTARGPRDSQGRSLRDLDLKTRIFKYPLSFLIYSPGFAELPPLVKSYVYRRLGEILSGADQSAPYAHLSAADRAAIREILSATLPAARPATLPKNAAARSAGRAGG